MPAWRSLLSDPPGGFLRGRACRRAMRLADRLLLPALALSLIAVQPASQAQPLTWVPVTPQASGGLQNSMQPQAIAQQSRPVWTPVPAADPEAVPEARGSAVPPATAPAASIAAPAAQPVWQPVTPGPSVATDVEPTTPPPAELAVLPPAASGPTLANVRALWRDGDWKPQISNLVPVGFGPRGVMLNLGGRLIDCTTGAGRCRVPGSWSDWGSIIESQGDGYINSAIGFGDSVKYVGVVITNTTQGVAVSGPRGQDQFLGGNSTGFHITRHFGPDTAVRLGVENWIRWDWPQADLEKNAYGVISQRIRLGSNPSGWFQNLYLTAGAGNGAFRPLDKQIGAQISAQKAAGCYTWNYAPSSEVDCSPGARERAVRDGSEFGALTFIGSAAVEVIDGFHLIGEWSGRNLNLGFSIRPFSKVGFVITPMFENILPNSDYGNNIEIPGAPDIAMPDNVLTDRARFSLQASLEVKF